MTAAPRADHACESSVPPARTLMAGSMPINEYSAKVPALDWLFAGTWPVSSNLPAPAAPGRPAQAHRNAPDHAIEAAFEGHLRRGMGRFADHLRDQREGGRWRSSSTTTPWSLARSIARPQCSALATSCPGPRGPTNGQAPRSRPASIRDRDERRFADSPARRRRTALARAAPCAGKRAARCAGQGLVFEALAARAAVPYYPCACGCRPNERC